MQYCLDRLYTSRISLNMLTNQHLMLHGYKALSPVFTTLANILPSLQNLTVQQFAVSHCANIAD